MSAVDQVFDAYERGLLSRRDALQAFLALAGAPAVAGAQQPAPKVVGRSINHVQLVVADKAKSKAFYAALVGTKLQKVYEQAGVETLALPGDGGWISISPPRDPKDKPGTMQHYAIGVENWDAKRVEADLKKLIPDITFARPTNQRSVFVSDPDGFVVQLVSKDDNGG